jgi:hypothetical protein
MMPLLTGCAQLTRHAHKDPNRSRPSTDWRRGPGMHRYPAFHPVDEGRPFETQTGRDAAHQPFGFSSDFAQWCLAHPGRRILRPRRVHGSSSTRVAKSPGYRRALRSRHARRDSSSARTFPGRWQPISSAGPRQEWLRCAFPFDARAFPQNTAPTRGCLLGVRASEEAAESVARRIMNWFGHQGASSFVLDLEND